MSLHTNMHIFYNSKVQSNLFTPCQALIEQKYDATIDMLSFILQAIAPASDASFS